MKSVLIPTSERGSPRFDTLCERLKAEIADDRNRVFAHLIIWFLKWAACDQTDCGIFWDANETRMGLWAEWPQPLAFGRALVQAGYCVPVNDVFPGELLRGRSGYVVPGSLDETWNGVHRNRSKQPPTASELILYLLDAEQRARYARSFKGQIIHPYPAGWLDLSTAGTSPDMRKPPDEFSSGPDPTQVQRRLNTGSTQVEHRLNTGSTQVDSPPAPHVSERSERNQEIKQRSERSKKRTTGKPKTTAMLATIRDHKYDNPLLCLLTMDDDHDAKKTWYAAIKTHLSEIQTLLSEMTETDDVWAAIGNPAALAMSRIRRMIRSEAQTR